MSILFNVLAGFFLISESSGEAEKGGDFSEHSGHLTIPAFLKNESLRLILGVLSMLMGLLKILSSTNGDIPVIGDLFPAAAGLVAGFVLVFDFYRNQSTLEEDQPVNAGRFLLNHKKVVGFAAIAAAALHFLFPSVLLL
ncbi:MAG: hypothetical protein LBP81_09795 [Treponema sp.]|nr:hypothetical protein [Treponema sp.]